jgi:hypothetical protein
MVNGVNSLLESGEAISDHIQSVVTGLDVGFGLLGDTISDIFSFGNDNDDTTKKPVAGKPALKSGQITMPNGKVVDMRSQSYRDNEAKEKLAKEMAEKYPNYQFDHANINGIMNKDLPKVDVNLTVESSEEFKVKVNNLPTNNSDGRVNSR